MSEKPKPTKEPVSERLIAKAPVRRMMKEVGAYLVADDAVDLLLEFLISKGGEITKTAIKIAEDDKRKKITGDDVFQAVKVQ